MKKTTKYPTINFIGNKKKITDWIVSHMPVEEGRILDLFSGGCSVSYALKRKGYEVHSNDILYSNYVLSKAFIENNEEILNENLNIKIDFDKYNDQYKFNVKFLRNKIFFDKEVDELLYLLKYSEELIGYKKYIYLSLLRRAMIRKLPYSRMNLPWSSIVKLRNEEYSYMKYGRKRAYHNLSFTEHMISYQNEYNNAVFDNGKKCKAIRSDVFDLINNTSEYYDVIYMDPPYPSTMNNYFGFYGAYDEIFNKEMEYTDFTKSNEFIEKFSRLILASRRCSDNIIISLNNKNKIIVDEIIIKIKSSFTSINVINKKHNYQISGKREKNANYEMLIILKK